MSDFDEFEILSSEDLEEFDSFISELVNEIEEEDEQTSVIDFSMYKTMQVSLAKIKSMFKGTGASVSYKLHEPYRSVGYISIVGKNLSIENPKVFAAISGLASNVEIYPKTNGTVQINLTYHGLTKPID